MIYFLQVIFPYIVLFYLIDCFVYVKNFQIIFYSHFGRRYKTSKKGIRFIGIFPFCRVLYATNFPFFLADTGIYYWNRDTFEENDLYELKNFSFISYTAIEKSECDGTLLVLNNNIRLHFNSSYGADFFGKNINELKNHLKKTREKIIEELYERPESINQIMEEYGFLFRLIQYLGMFLFIYTFLLIPSVLYLNFPLNLKVLLITMAVSFVLIAGLSFFAHGKIIKNRGKNFLFLFSLIFSPVTPIHVLHSITRDIALSLEWMIPASSLLEPETFKHLLIKELKRIHLSKEKNRDINLDSFLIFKEKIYMSLLEKNGIAPEEILNPPEKKDPVAYSYCSFCGAEFMEGVEKCPDCDIQLKRYNEK